MAGGRPAGLLPRFLLPLLLAGLCAAVQESQEKGCGSKDGGCGSARRAVARSWRASPANVTGPDSCKALGCAGYVPGASCQCTAKCAELQNCCRDYAERCIPMKTHAGTVGLSVNTDWVLVRFWALALLCFGLGVFVVSLSFNLSGTHRVLKQVFRCLDAVSVDDEPQEGHDGQGGPDSHASDCDGDKLPEDGLSQQDFKTVYEWWGMHFKDPVLENKWSARTAHARISDGAVACVAAISMVGVVVYAVAQTRCVHFSSRITTWVNLFIAMVLLGASVTCVYFPSERLFWPTVLGFFLYFPAQCLPPFGMSCEELRNLCSGSQDPWMVQQYHHVDCSMQGQTCVQLLMTWILITPWVMPRVEHMHGIWAWILCVFVGWTMSYRRVLGETVYDVEETVYRVVLLSGVLLIACHTKYMLERGHRTKFKHDVQQAESTKRMFAILEFMVPPHVIPPMLTNAEDPIAESINHVSILFLVIDDFDRHTRERTPTQLLLFLNEQFTSFDKICVENGVTKIETVGEEYVACVGVLPDDVRLCEERGHDPLLDRLFTAARQLLELQGENVKYKMGLHTGPIVAGVIGTKLPRYRLFGDTINSAGRMMQKGLPGQVQFGEATYADMGPEWKRLVSYRGEVEMKGKGFVKAYTFAPKSGNDGGRQRRGGGRMQVSFRGTITAHLYTDGSIAQASVLKVPVKKECAFSAGEVEQDEHRDSADRDFTMRFEDTLQSMREKSGRHWWLLRETEGFTTDMEREWQQWQHDSALTYKAQRRFALMALLVMGISAIELHFVVKIQVWRYPHPLYKSRWRWAVYIFSRMLVVLLQMLWWHAMSTMECIRTSPKKTQAVLMLTICTSVMLLYIGYDAILFSDTSAYRNYVRFTNNFRSPEDQFLSLNFVLLYSISMRTHNLTFYQSFCFVPLTVLIVALPQIYSWSHPESDKWETAFSDKAVFLLLSQTLINAAISHEDENKSRARFKAQRAVKITSTRTKDILDKLMPPLVVEELRNIRPGAALPSHQYRHATIAQSDLCGFTKLASTKKPTEVVTFMGELFGAFDVLTDKWQVCKVETIGDAYIAGMAEKPLTRTNSPIAVVQFGLDMVRAVDVWARHLGVDVACRVGVHYGECIGGIVGNAMQRYHLFGNLLVVMDTLEATSVEGRVQVSTACKEEVERQLRDDPGASAERIIFVTRAGDELKTSKGEVHTFEEVGGTTYLIDSDQPLRRH